MPVRYVVDSAKSPPIIWLCGLLTALFLHSVASPAHLFGSEPNGLSTARLQHLRSIFSNRCFACHGPDADQRQAGFRLDQGESVYQPAESGRVPVVPHKLDESELLKRLTTDDVDQRMPPADFGKPLTTDEVALVREWIASGAPPLKHWSFVPPSRPAVPEAPQPEALASARTLATSVSGGGAIPAHPGQLSRVQEGNLHEPSSPYDPSSLAAWIGNPIDRFVLAKQLEHKLAPSPSAARDVLLRRMSLDLIGVPPSQATLDAFLEDDQPDAIERSVDRLLASPQYGEHWSRKWLDLARYADSAGYADDPPRVIWAYRDWVVRAINSNMPLDEFTVAQIAGDLLPNPSEDDLIATAFHRNTLTNNEGGTNDEEFRNVAVVDRVNTTMAVWMGVTFNCAQCHTHKYDPFTQEEYFKIFAIFNQSQDADRRDESPLVEIFTPEQLRQRKSWMDRSSELRKQLQVISPEVQSQFDSWVANSKSPTWSTLAPQSFRAKTNTEANWNDAGQILVKTMQSNIVADTFSLELSLPSDTETRPIRAIGLRTLPNKELPGGGVGLGGGNFVLTDVTANVVPADSTATKARWIRLDLPGKERILSLAEVQAFAGGTNVATKGKASQSSTDYGGEAARAIDGKTAGIFDKKSVTHTASSDDPWWELDLGSSLPIDRVQLWNRTDGAIHSRLNGVQISLLDEDRKPLFTHTIAEASKESMTVDISHLVPIKLVAAYADYEQPDFHASSVIDSDKASGWAVGGQIQQEHLLTLVPSEPIAKASGGKLRLELGHDSTHREHLIASFEVVVSYDDSASEWARMNDAERVLAAKTASERTPAEQEILRAFFAQRLAPLNDAPRRELEEIEKQLVAMKPETNVPVMRDMRSQEHRKTFVQLRGNYKSLGPEVVAGVPEVFHPVPADATMDRLQLARWLTARENPLTARVMANRTWEALFGLGIVRTSEEFGSQGDLPSHPDLLDWLATELMDLQWDNKRFLRTLVLTQTYQQTSEVSSRKLDADADNVWLARGPRVRLSAEMVRDQALAAADLLSHKMYGPPVRPPQPSLGLSAAFGSKTDWEASQGEDRYRRGLYTTWRRSNPYPSMATFDAPSREVCTLRRDSTNTPLQALVTLNDPSFVEAAQALARRVLFVDGVDKSDRERLQLAFRACTSRAASDRELNALDKLLQEAQSQLAQQPDDAKKLATEPLGALPPNADAVQCAAWTAVSNVLLNLDEVLMKR